MAQYEGLRMGTHSYLLSSAGSDSKLFLHHVLEGNFPSAYIPSQVISRGIYGDLGWIQNGIHRLEDVDDEDLDVMKPALLMGCESNMSSHLFSFENVQDGIGVYRISEKMNQAKNMMRDDNGDVDISNFFSKLEKEISEQNEEGRLYPYPLDEALHSQWAMMRLHIINSSIDFDYTHQVSSLSSENNNDYDFNRSHHLTTVDHPFYSNFSLRTYNQTIVQQQSVPIHQIFHALEDHEIVCDSTSFLTRIFVF